MNILRATETWQQAGAYYVRIQGMARQHHIPLREEFDAHDGPNAKYIVLLDKDFPVATCRLYPVDGVRMMLGRIVVLPEYRGKGLGRRVVEEAEQWTRELGYRIAVLERRDIAVGFYEKLGYTADRSRVIRGGTFLCTPWKKSCESKRTHNACVLSVQSISLRPCKARRSVTSSAYSSWLPIGMP